MRLVCVEGSGLALHIQSSQRAGGFDRSDPSESSVGVPRRGTRDIWTVERVIQKYCPESPI